MQLPEFADNACRKVIYSYGHICGIYKAEQLVYLTHIVPSHCCALKLVETVEGRSTLPWLPKGQSSMLRDWPLVDARRQKRKYVSQPGVKSIVSHDPVVVDDWRSSSKVKRASTCGT